MVWLVIAWALGFMVGLGIGATITLKAAQRVFKQRLEEALEELHTELMK